MIKSIQFGSKIYRHFKSICPIICHHNLYSFFIQDLNSVCGLEHAAVWPDMFIFNSKEQFWSSYNYKNICSEHYSVYGFTSYV